jgi:hypothetical protein
LLLADKKVVTSPSKRGQKESTEGGKRKEAKRKKNYKEGKIRHNLKKKKRDIQRKQGEGRIILIVAHGVRLVANESILQTSQGEFYYRSWFASITILCFFVFCPLIYVFNLVLILSCGMNSFKSFPEYVRNMITCKFFY